MAVHQLLIVACSLSGCFRINRKRLGIAVGKSGGKSSVADCKILIRHQQRSKERRQVWWHIISCQLLYQNVFLIEALVALSWLLYLCLDVVIYN